MNNGPEPMEIDNVQYQDVNFPNEPRDETCP